MARGIARLMKTASGMVAQVPGGEEIVMEAVRDIFMELKKLRRENHRLQNENQRLRERLDRAGARPVRAAGSTVAPAKRAPAKRTAAAKRAPARKVATPRTTRRRRGGLLGDLLG
ncbi:MAG: hypothetical protein ACRENL_05550 [Candidatus Dormibacteria bacterium]